MKKQTKHHLLTIKQYARIHNPTLKVRKHQSSETPTIFLGLKMAPAFITEKLYRSICHTKYSTFLLLRPRHSRHSALARGQNVSSHMTNHKIQTQTLHDVYTSLWQPPSRWQCVSEKNNDSGWHSHDAEILRELPTYPDSKRSHLAGGTLITVNIRQGLVHSFFHSPKSQSKQSPLSSHNHGHTARTDANKTSWCRLKHLQRKSNKSLTGPEISAAP